MPNPGTLTGIALSGSVRRRFQHRSGHPPAVSGRPSIAALAPPATRFTLYGTLLNEYRNSTMTFRCRFDWLPSVRPKTYRT